MTTRTRLGGRLVQVALRVVARRGRRRWRQAGGLARGAAVAGLVVVVGWLGGALALEGALAFTEAPDIAVRAASSRAVYDREGGLLRLSLSSDERYRLPVRLEEIAPAAVEAVLFHEDRRFYDHEGVDTWALGRAVVRTYVVRDRREGASTLTMQLARMRFGIDSRGVGGKLEQLWQALVIEHHHDKRAILEAYFALLPYGGNVEGIEAASLLYFGKRAAALTDDEATALAVVPQSPDRRSPLTERGQRALREAADRLRAAQGKPGLGVLAFGGVGAARPGLAPHFADALLADEPPVAGLDAHVPSTLDPAKQATLAGLVARYAARHREVGIDNAAVLLVDTRDRSVLAEVGSARYFDKDIQGQVNGTRAKRSPGSTLKPFIYALALDDGLIHPASLLADAPRRYTGFNPENHDRAFQGPMPATEALVRSRNLPAVELLHTLGLERLRDLLVDGGVQGLRDVDHYGLALALGGAEVTLHELLTLYVALARGGEVAPLVERTDRPGPQGGRPLVSDGAALLTLRMLASHRRPSQGFDDAWTTNGLKVAWKTGTSHGFRDAWTVGVFGHYALGVWVGRFDGEGRPAFRGAGAAAPLFFEIVDALRDDAGSFEPTPPPEEVTRVEVCAVSGQVPGPHCRHTKTTSFLAGRSPITPCEVHREVFVRRESGLRACPGREDEAGVEPLVVEQWPSDLARMFADAGLPRRGPPPFEGGCVALDEGGRGLAPKIVSPLDEAEIRISAVGKEASPVVLRAVTGTDSRHHDWYADERFLGRTARDASLEWQPQVGRTTLRVVDDRGRADEVRVHVATLR